MSAPLRLGIVGTGYIAGVVATALQETERVVLSAVASRDLARAAGFGARYFPHLSVQPFEDWRELVSWDGIDAVYLASPTVGRTEIAVAAATHGKHVLAEKPFTNVASLSAMVEACSAHGVAFMDATHFVHHPRHALLRRTLGERIGTFLALNATFTFPSMDRGNIRFDSALEPTGAWGDMGWYAMRALVEFTPDDATVVHASAAGVRDAQSGAVVRSDGVLRLTSGCTATWDVAFDIGTNILDLHLMGDRGRVRLDDFVLDWAGGSDLRLPGHVAEVQQQVGVVNPSGVVVERVPTERRQLVQLLEDFADLARDPMSEAGAAGTRATMRTQRLMDEVWGRHVIA